MGDVDEEPDGVVGTGVCPGCGGVVELRQVGWVFYAGCYWCWTAYERDTLEELEEALSSAHRPALDELGDDDAE